ncbi:MAG TPA: alpha-1,2-fucosyltransferase [Chitinophagales bacterium]|nr:alpha-1,2-fucosyltransferase [Chitinophagales bacterium]
MIKVLLSGGLGNQLFQYAFGKTLAIINNTSLILSTSFIESKLPIKKLATQMKYELSIFYIDAEIEHNFITGKIVYPFAKTEYLLRDKFNEKKMILLQEKSFEFQIDFLDYKDNTYAKGNFQSAKYFESIESILRKELIFKNALIDKNLEWKTKIQSSNSISIHIRRGDYISIQKNQDKFVIQSLDYYKSAIAYIASKISQPTFFVFSDDISWTKDNLKADFPMHFIDNNNTAETSYIDMQLMSLCKHNIICNSTFSWWSAWLNANPLKIVIAPQNWFADKSINSQDLIPSEWIKL